MRFEGCCFGVVGGVSLMLSLEARFGLGSPSFTYPGTYSVWSVLITKLREAARVCRAGEDAGGEHGSGGSGSPASGGGGGWLLRFPERALASGSVAGRLVEWRRGVGWFRVVGARDFDSLPGLGSVSLID